MPTTPHPRLKCTRSDFQWTGTTNGVRQREARAGWGAVQWYVVEGMASPNAHCCAPSARTVLQRDTGLPVLVSPSPLPNPSSSPTWSGGSNSTRGVAACMPPRHWPLGDAGAVGTHDLQDHWSARIRMAGLVTAPCPLPHTTKALCGGSICVHAVAGSAAFCARWFDFGWAPCGSTGLFRYMGLQCRRCWYHNHRRCGAVAENWQRGNLCLLKVRWI
mmetsp:Transcript_67938/g.114150  ORF Transcript_67938/g.114150 Transcript_67938/m.114150 type:complete len:217 (-) Transcript_67938:42-692(-)